MSKTQKYGNKTKYIGAIISFVVAILLYILPKIFTDTTIDIVGAFEMMSLLWAYSTVLAFIFSHNVSQSKDDIVQNTVPVVNGLKNSNSKEHHEIVKSLVLLSSEFTPQDYSPAGYEPNTEFNAVIHEELCKQRCHHFYFSNRAFYHTWRLHNYLIDIRTSEFSIALPHIQEDKIFIAMADNYIQKEIPTGNRKQQIEELVKTAREDSYKSIYYTKRLIEDGLNITLYIHSEIPFIRFEQTDDILALSFLPMSKEGNYPPSIIYKRDTLHWDAFNAYSRQIMQGCVDCLKSAKGIMDYLKENYNKLCSDLSFEQYILRLDDSFDSLVVETKK